MKKEATKSVTIGKVAIGLIIILAISPIIVYFSVPSYSTSAASIPVVNNLVVVADSVFVNELQIETKQTTLAQGDLIRTSETGRALINFFDGSSTQLEPNITISVDELSMTKAGSTTIQFTQQIGRTWSRVAKLVDTKSSFNIQTDAAVAVIRGTLIAIDVQEGDDDKQITEVKVFEGLSDVVANGQTVEVASGSQTTVDEGEPPEDPVEIPPPPSELKIRVASPVWLHVADPLERNVGIVPPGFEANEIPYSVNSGILGGVQTVDITEPISGRYYVMMHAQGDGPVTLTVDSYNNGLPFESRAYETFNVVDGGTYYITVDLQLDDSRRIMSFDASNLYLPPQADFTTDKTSDDGKAEVAVGESLQFTGDYGSGHYTSTEWDFGNGSKSLEDAPVYTYAAAGVYTVTHVVDNPVARQTQIKTEYITVYDAPSADFVSNYTEVVAGDSVGFSDTSAGAPTAWNWSFGDGGTSTDQNPSHTYSDPGTYTVSLNVSNLAGDDTETKAGHVKVYAPIVADLTADPTSAIVNVPVQFTDASIGVARTWIWDFGDGGTSTEQNPAYAYTSTGTYTVSLDVTNPLDDDQVTKDDYIMVYPQPVAVFEADQTLVVVGTTIDFIDRSTGDISAWAWDFGDQETSEDQNPSHRYDEPGVYSVSLTASNPGGPDDELRTDYITVYSAPQTDFSADDTEVYVGQSVQFTDSTTGVPLLWQPTYNWDFGDESSSTDQDPAHSYSSPGTYTVSLTVTNPSGDDTQEKMDYITVYGPPVADFSADDTTVFAGQSVQFTDLTTGIPSLWQPTYSWDFGDQGTSTDQNPAHSYSSPGTYAVSLTVTNPSGNDTITKTDYLSVYGPPEADFIAEQTYILVGTTVNFADLSTGDVMSWQWDFGDQGTSTDQNPSHIYNQPGLYSVSLTASNPAGGDVELKQDYITVYAPPKADFSADTLLAEVGQPVQFTDLSTGMPSAWQWEFGDESGSEDQNPIHTFDSPGTYTIFLMVSNSAGVATEDKEDYITVYDVPVVDFSVDIAEVEIGQQVQFTDLSIGDPFAWEWDFESDRLIDSTEQNPSHTYDSIGIYTVTLTATNAEGDGVGVKVGYIYVYEPAEVVITSPSNYENQAENFITVEGSVVGMLDGEVMIIVNDDYYYFAFVSEGFFSQRIRIGEGENIITVESWDPAYYGSDSITVYGPPPDIKVVLTWDGEDSDFDNHLIWPQYPNYWEFYGDRHFDCHYSNENPDWDYNEHSSSGDPMLNEDMYDAGDPEIITIDEVYTEEGMYERFWVFIHYYGDDGGFGDSTAIVEIWIEGQLVQTYSKLMEEYYIWECAYIDWDDGTGTVHAGPVEDGYYHEDDLYGPPLDGGDQELE